MKKIFKLSIIALVLLCTVAQVSDAKTRRRHSSSSSSSGVPSYQAFSDAIGNPQKMKELGISKLYEDITPATDDDPEIGVVYYGKDVKIVPRGGYERDIIATGPHAFFSEDSWAVEADHDFGFKNKADRDKFYNQMLKAGYDKENISKSYFNGWYWISIGD